MTVFYCILAGMMALYVLNKLAVALLCLRLDPLRTDTTQRLAVLVAARNEEARIGQCLRSLLAQHYPQGMLEIWVGDDGSTDGTAAIVQALAAQHPSIRYVRITEQWPGQRGKQNVLAQLARRVQQAHGPATMPPYLLVTDADILHTPHWAAQLAATLALPGVHMATGPTLANGNSLYAGLQSLDWLVGICTMNAFSRLGLPITAVGNNMGFRADTYFALGGYEAIEFSITEDYKLFEVFHKAGYRLQWVYNRAALCTTWPIGGGLRGYLHQRKRWYQGGKEGPWYAVMLFALFATLVPLLAVALAVLPWAWVWPLLAAKVAADWLLQGSALLRLGRYGTLPLLPVYELYFALATLVLPLYFLVPTQVVWKGRSY